MSSQSNFFFFEGHMSCQMNTFIYEIDIIASHNSNLVEDQTRHTELQHLFNNNNLESNCVQITLPTKLTSIYSPVVICSRSS